MFSFPRSFPARGSFARWTTATMRCVPGKPASRLSLGVWISQHQYRILSWHREDFTSLFCFFYLIFSLTISIFVQHKTSLQSKGVVALQQGPGRSPTRQAVNNRAGDDMVLQLRSSVCGRSPRKGDPARSHNRLLLSVLFFLASASQFPFVLPCPLCPPRVVLGLPMSPIPRWRGARSWDE